MRANAAAETLSVFNAVSTVTNAAAATESLNVFDAAHRDVNELEHRAQQLKR